MAAWQADSRASATLRAPEHRFVAGREAVGPHSRFELTLDRAARRASETSGGGQKPADEVFTDYGYWRRKWVLPEYAPSIKDFPVLIATCPMHSYVRKSIDDHVVRQLVRRSEVLDGNKVSNDTIPQN